jgi:hypothetical protein
MAEVIKELPRLVEIDGRHIREALLQIANGNPDVALANPSALSGSQLLDRLENAQIRKWLKSPNPAFDGSTPLQIVEHGEVDRLWHMLYDLESGQPG